MDIYRLETLFPATNNPLLQRQGLTACDQLKTFVQDRPGHDRRYAIDATKIRQQLGWRPKYTLDQGLSQTVQWYLDHRDWREDGLAGKYARQRLGLTKAADGSPH